MYSHPGINMEVSILIIIYMNISKQKIISVLDDGWFYQIV